MMSIFDYLDEWDERNWKIYGIAPTKDAIVEFSHKASDMPVYWVCKRGGCECHVWRCSIKERISGVGCPYCDGKICVHTSIVTKQPGLMQEWDYERNGLNPAELPPTYKRKVHWVCRSEAGRECGCHRWQATVYRRVCGEGCPYCAGHTACEHTSLATYPELCQEWDTQRNKVDPSKVSVKSKACYNWICENKHSWKAKVSERLLGIKCTICTYNGKVLYRGSGRVAAPSILETYPLLAKEWDTQKNKSGPDMISSDSHRLMSWVCTVNREHRWDAYIYSRVQGMGCPCCRLMSNLNLLESKEVEVVEAEIMEVYEVEGGEYSDSE